MTTQEIEVLFFKTINQTAVYNKLEGITRNQIYNWINGRGSKPNLGNMLNVLYQLGYVEIVKTNKKKESQAIDFCKKGINLITGFAI